MEDCARKLPLHSGIIRWQKVDHCWKANPVGIVYGSLSWKPGKSGENPRLPSPLSSAFSLTSVYSFRFSLFFLFLLCLPLPLFVFQYVLSYITCFTSLMRIHHTSVSHNLFVTHYGLPRFKCCFLLFYLGQVNFIEHVQAFISIRASRRGDIVMFLTSPMNTTSMILGARPRDDDARRGFTKWPFMTTHMWGETPRGTWRLTIGLDPQKKVGAPSEDALGHALLTEWILMVHGTQRSPYAALPESASRLVPKLDIVKRQHLSSRFSQ